MKLSNLAAELRRHGLAVVETDGWATRGYRGQDMIAVAGQLWHHTATNRARFADSNAPTLAMCINGRTDLAGPLCNIVLGRDGTVYMVAAGWANHAGRGAAAGIPNDMGNAYLIGIEMESSGIAPWDWTLDQLRAAPRLGAALERITGAPLVLGHMEYSTEGKIDPAGWPGGMQGLRDQINAVLDGTTESEFDVNTTEKINAIYDRIFGRDVQRYFNPKTMEVRETPFAGAIPARSTDVHDVMSTNNHITGTVDRATNKILDAIAAVPSVDADTIEELRAELGAELRAATAGLTITLTTPPQEVSEVLRRNADAAEAGQ